MQSDNPKKKYTATVKKSVFETLNNKSQTDKIKYVPPSDEPSGKIGMGDLKQSEYENRDPGPLDVKRTSSDLKDLYQTPQDATKREPYSYKRLDDKPIIKKVYKDRTKDPTNREPLYPIPEAEETQSGSIVPQDINKQLNDQEQQLQGEYINKINSGDIKLPFYVKMLPQTQQLQWVGAAYNNNPVFSAIGELANPLIHLENVLRGGIDKVFGTNTGTLTPSNLTPEDADDELLNNGVSLSINLIPLAASIKGANLLLKGIKSPYLRHMLSSALGFTINSQPELLDNLSQGKITLKDYAIANAETFGTGLAFGLTPPGTKLRYEIPYQTVVPTMVPVITKLVQGQEIDDKQIINSMISNVVLSMVMGGKLPKTLKVEQFAKTVEKELSGYKPEQLTRDLVETKIAGLLEAAKNEGYQDIPFIDRETKTIENVRVPQGRDVIEVDEKGNAVYKPEKKVEPMISPIKLTEDQIQTLRNKGLSDEEIKQAQENIDKSVYATLPELQPERKVSGLLPYGRAREVIEVDEKGNAKIDRVKEDEEMLPPVRLTEEQITDLRKKGMTDAEIQEAQVKLFGKPQTIKSSEKEIQKRTVSTSEAKRIPEKKGNVPEDAAAKEEVEKVVNEIGEKVDPVGIAVKQYGWTTENTDKGIKVFNRNNKHVATVIQNGKNYKILHSNGEKLLSGNSDVSNAIKDVAEQFFYAKKLEGKEVPEQKKVQPISSPTPGEVKEGLKDKIITHGEQSFQKSRRKNIVDVPIDEINTDTKRFQNRDKEFSEESVQSIVDAVKSGDFDFNKFDEIRVWKDPKTNKYFVLAGHSRLEAFKRLKKEGIKGFETIPSSIMDVPESEAIKFAKEESNVLGTQESHTERAGLYHSKRQSGTQEKDIKKEVLKREKKNSSIVYALSFLNPKGKTISALKSLGSTNLENKSVIETVASYVGKARQELNALTDQHENEMFEWLMKSDNMDKFKNKTEFVDRIEKVTNRLDFKPEQILNLDNKIHRSSAEQIYDKRLAELKSELKDAKDKLDERRKYFTGKGITGDELTNKLKNYEDVIRLVQKDVNDFEKSRNDAIKNAESQEIDMFGGGPSLQKDSRKKEGKKLRESLKKENNNVKFVKLREKANNLAREYFGTTENPEEAAYILTDGDMLDYSYGSGKRVEDHRLMPESFYDDANPELHNLGMKGFIHLGNIRWMPESQTFHLYRKPTPEQQRTMRKIIDKYDGDVSVMAQYGKGEWDEGWGNHLNRGPEFGRSYEKYSDDASSIMQDINDFFDSGDLSRDRTGGEDVDLQKDTESLKDKQIKSEPFKGVESDLSSINNRLNELAKAKELVSKSFPESKIITVNDSDMGKLMKVFKKDVSDTPLAATYEGKVYINKDKANASTPFHEIAGHIFNRIIAQTHPELWEIGKKIALSSKEYSEKVRRDYPELAGDRFADEILSQAVGDSGERLVKSLIREGKKEEAARFKKWIARFWDAVKSIFKKEKGIESLTPNSTIREWADVIAKEISKGRKLETDAGPMEARFQKAEGNMGDLTNKLKNLDERKEFVKKRIAELSSGDKGEAIVLKEDESTQGGLFGDAPKQQGLGLETVKYENVERAKKFKDELKIIDEQIAQVQNSMSQLRNVSQPQTEMMFQKDSGSYMNDVKKKVEEITDDLRKQGFKGEALRNRVSIETTKHLFNDDPTFKSFPPAQKRAVMKEMKRMFRDEYRKESHYTVDGFEYVEKGFRDKVWNRGLKQSLNVVKDMGDAGKEFANRMEQKADDERALMGKAEGVIIDISKLSKNEYDNLTDRWEAKMNEQVPPETISENVQGVETQINQYFEDIAGMLKQRGFTTTNKKSGDIYSFTPKEDYRPRMLNTRVDKLGVVYNVRGEPVYNKEREKVLEHLVDTKQANDFAQASLLLDERLSKDRIFKAGNVEYSRLQDIRLPDEYYIRDPKESLIKYAKRVSKRIAFVDNWGMDGSIEKRLLDDMRKNHRNYKFAEELFRFENDQLTQSERDALKTVNSIKGLQALTKFTPFTTLRNSVQGFLGSTTRGNLLAGIKAIHGSMDPVMRRYARESGALADSIENYISESFGGESQSAIGKMTGKYLDWIQFTRTDRANRIVAAIGGLEFMKDMLKRVQKDSVLKKRALREFEKMGLDIDKVIDHGGFTEAQEKKIMRRFAYETQFGVRAKDLPLFWSSPYGKLATQWKPFGYKMTQLIRDSIIGELKQGNAFPLLTYMVAYGVTGEGINYVIDHIRHTLNFNPKGDDKRDPNEESLIGQAMKGNIGGFLKRYIEDLAGLGALSFMVDIGRSMGYDKSGAEKLLLGPALSELAQSFGDVVGPGAMKVFGYNQDEDFKETMRKTLSGITKTAIRNLPGSGLLRTFGITKRVQDWLFPPKSRDQYEETLSGQDKDEYKKIKELEKERDDAKEDAMKSRDEKDIQRYRELNKELDKLRDGSKIWKQRNKFNNLKKKEEESVLQK